MISLSMEEYQELSEENCGVCTNCGEYSYCTEPDAREYLCESCEENTVYGLMEALFMGEINIE